MPHFAKIAVDGTSSEYTKFAVGIDIRSGLAGSELAEAVRAMDSAGIKYEILFLDAADDILVKRYKETRRTHPLSGKAGSVESGIRKERKQLKELKDHADYILDTSKLLTRELKKEIMRIFVEDQHYKNLYITLQSFGFKYGIPAILTSSSTSASCRTPTTKNTSVRLREMTSQLSTSSCPTPRASNL